MGLLEKLVLVIAGRSLENTTNISFITPYWFWEMMVFLLSRAAGSWPVENNASCKHLSAIAVWVSDRCFVWAGGAHRTRMEVGSFRWCSCCTLGTLGIDCEAEESRMMRKKQTKSCEWVKEWCLLSVVSLAFCSVSVEFIEGEILSRPNLCSTLPALRMAPCFICRGLVPQSSLLMIL